MSQRRSTARLGCGFIALIVVVSCALLAVNGLIVANVLQSTRDSIPPVLRQERWIQTISFLGPVLMLVVQWWAYDVASDWLWPLRSGRAARRGDTKG
jgi:hypothetical protein